jgi:hypothetical protein
LTTYGFSIILLGIVGLVQGCGSSTLNTASLSLSNQVTDQNIKIQRLGDRLELGDYDMNSPFSKIIGEFNGELIVDSDNSIWLTKQATEDTLVGELGEDGKVRFCEDAGLSSCTLQIGYKHPETNEDSNSPILTIGFRASQTSNLDLPNQSGRTNTLVPFALSSPDQESAGSCLYMASTGAMEVILNSNSRSRDLRSEGATDLSERFTMNIGLDHALNNWKTDTVLLFNRENGAVRNKDYRYTKGWYKTEGGATKPAEKTDPEAEYGPQVNWVYGITPEVQSKKINVPKIKRNIIFKDPSDNLWNAGIMGRGVIRKVQDHLRYKNSPVLVIYNHYGYWHAALILGFDENKEHEQCPMVKNYLETMEQNPIQKQYVKKIKNSMAVNGECATKGIFYVRDSIYTGNPSKIYDYDLSQTGEETPYSKRIVEHSFEWLLYMGNHAYTVEKM